MRKSVRKSDPRTWVPNATVAGCCSQPSLAGFGLTFVCNNLDVALTELKQLLDAAASAGLLTIHWFSANEGDPTAVSAQAVYDQTVNNNVVIESQPACDAYTAQVQAANLKLRALLNAQSGAGAPPPLLPDYQPTNDTNPLPTSGSLTTMLIAGAVIVGSVALFPVVMELVGWSKMTRRAHTAGRRFTSKRKS